MSARPTRRDGAVLRLRQTSWAQAPTTLRRFNGISSYEIQGQAAAGQELGRGDGPDRGARRPRCPASSVAWSGLSYQERLSGGQAPILYALSLLVVFLCLAALYESWSIPVSVLLVIPLGLVGAALAVTLRGLDQRRLFPGRPADHDGPVGQERDPDRRVRRAGREARQARRSTPRWRRRGSGCGRS